MDPSPKKNTAAWYAGPVKLEVPKRCVVSDLNGLTVENSSVCSLLTGSALLYFISFGLTGLTLSEIKSQSVHLVLQDLAFSEWN